MKITDVDEKQETIDFEGGMTLLWHDPRLAYDPREYGLEPEDVPSHLEDGLPPRIYQGDYAVKEVFAGWRPHIRINNGIGDRQISYMGIAIWPDGHIAYTDQFHATAETRMNLRRFPFDSQELEIHVTPYAMREFLVELVHAPALAGSWEQDAGIADWTSGGVEVERRETSMRMLDGTERTFSELVATIKIERRPGHILFSMILPLLLLVALSWCVFWMDESAISDRVNVSFVGILSVVAYYFVVLDTIPETHYPTLMDGFMLTTFALLAATVVINFVVDGLNRRGQKTRGDRVDLVCRWAFPLGYVVLSGVLFGYFSTF
jgi:hypothetical protein